MSYTPESACREISACIQNSKLHFVTQETPYSVYITIRKKFMKQTTQINEGSVNVVENEENEKQFELLSEAKNENSKLEQLNNSLKIELEKFKAETEQLNRIIKSKNDEISTLKKVTAKLNNELNENKTAAAETKKATNDMKRSLKLKEKELYEIRKKNEKHEEKIAELEDFKRNKIMEDKSKEKAEKKRLKKKSKLLFKKGDESFGSDSKDEDATTSTKSTISTSKEGYGIRESSLASSIILPQNTSVSVNDCNINSPQSDIPSNSEENTNFVLKPTDDHEQEYKSEQTGSESSATFESSKFWNDFRLKLTADINALLAKGTT